MLRDLTMGPAMHFINSIPFAGIMAVVAVGFLVGRMEWRGMSLGPAGGTVIVALLAGSAGLDLIGLYASADSGVTLGRFGFALFIYSVGFEAGPRFSLGSMTDRAWRVAVVALVVNGVALFAALLGGRILGLSASATAGLLAGALTSAPTYAAASEVATDSTALAVTFAVTYPLGLVGVVLLVQFLPRMMKDDLAVGTDAPDSELAPSSESALLRRVFRVENDDVVGSSLHDLQLNHRTGGIVTLVHHGSEVKVPQASEPLSRGDHVMVKGRLEQLQAIGELVGPEVYDDDLRRGLPSPRAVVVSSRSAVDRTLRELDLVRRFNCLVTEVTRGDVTLDAEADLRLARHDVLLVAGRRDDVRRLAREIGRFERSTHETDIAIYAGGILFGLLLGQLSLRIWGLDLEIGSAGGLLVVGIALGRLRQIGPFSAHVPVAARQLVRDLGILLFVAEAGAAAGAAPMSAMSAMIAPIVVVALLTTALPVIAAAIVGRWLLGMPPADTWGSIGGGMTSSAALAAVRSAADSNEPAISYATAFAVASVLATLAGRVIVLAF